MLRRALFSSLALAAFARADNQNHEAPVTENNPEGAAFVAMFPNRPDTTIRGNITAVTAPGGLGVQFAVDIEGLPMEGGPFRTPIPDHYTLGASEADNQSSVSHP